MSLALSPFASHGFVCLARRYRACTEGMSGEIVRKQESCVEMLQICG